MLANHKFALLLLLAVGCVQGGNYLKEAPEFLKPCKTQETRDGQCLSHSLQAIFRTWKDGIPGLKGLSGFDPFHVKKIRFAQNTQGLTDIRAEVDEVVVHGFSKLNILNTSFNDKDYTLKMLVNLPKLKIAGDYKIKGRLLVLNLDGKGEMTCDLADLQFVAVAKSKLLTVDGETFFDLTSLKSDIRNIGDFRIKMSNLFGGNKELEDSAHEFINTSWRQMFEIMRPAILQTLDKILEDRYRKIMRYIPVRYIIDDLA